MFYFRRDLRICDNKGLIFAKKFEPLFPIFIFDQRQINFLKNNNFMNVLVEAVQDLDNYLKAQKSKLFCAYGDPCDILENYLKATGIKNLVFNADYSSYSRERDNKIIKMCEKNGVNCFIVDDLTLCLPEKLVSCFDKRYWKFVENLGELSIKPQKCETRFVDFEKCKKYYEDLDLSSFFKENDLIPISATRKFAISRVKVPVNRGLLISSHLKLGLISPREVYFFIQENWPTEEKEAVLKQLLWREFYFAFTLTTPNIYDFIDPRFKTIKWLNKPEEIKKMWSGQTGFPLIDAAMTELNKTGFMTNRGRLLVGFFSVKILRINPFSKWGGQLYFSKKLIDCCYANNTGNWHWVASDALDASGQRYSAGWAGRPTDPRNSKKYDPQCEYIQKWLNLKLTPKEIHSWPTDWKKLKKKCKYYKPMVDFSKRWKEWLSLTK